MTNQPKCQPGAWGGPGCLAHQGFDLDSEGLCIDGRSVRDAAMSANQPKVNGAAGRCLKHPPSASCVSCGACICTPQSACEGCRQTYYERQGQR
jgi:hypothetical protein